MKFLISLFLSSLFSSLLFANGSTKPNIILINAYDLGYGDLSSYGATKIQTPNTDQLAKEGRRFTDAHSASAVCSPSRYGLLTGQYPLRKNFWGPASGALSIDVKQATLASILKSAGYATAVIGKWHLGFGKTKCDWNKPLKPGPLELGFDYYFGMPTVNSGGPFVYVENHSVVNYDPKDPFVKGKKSLTQQWPEKSKGQFGGADQAHLLYRDEKIGTTFAKKAVDWIQAHEQKEGEQPFFMYFATTNIHHPFTPHPRFKGTSQCGMYGDFVHELDWMVGQLVSTLEDLDITDETMIIFTSDNGGMLNKGGQAAWKKGHPLNGELLGMKFGAWEGGHRIPFIVKWPEKTPAGSESSTLISQIDLLATLAALTKVTIPEDSMIDSINQLGELTGKAKYPARESLVICPNSPQHLSLRKGKWVYIPTQGEGGFQGKKIGDHLLGGPAAHLLTKQVHSDVLNGKLRKGAPVAQLYNLEDNPSQSKNVYEEYPEVVEELSEMLKTWQSKIPKTKPLGWINLNQKKVKK